MCIESRVKDGSAEFVMICPNARFHGNWIKAVQGGDYNEGLFECLCAPYQDEEDEFEPHGESLEAYYRMSIQGPRKSEDRNFRLTYIHYSDQSHHRVSLLWQSPVDTAQCRVRAIEAIRHFGDHEPKHQE